MIVQDVNADGRPDLLVANSGDDTASQVINRYDPTNLYRYTPAAFDPDGDPISYQLLDSPGGMLMNEVTGEIIWAPTADQVGLNSVVIEASDVKAARRRKASRSVCGTQSPEQTTCNLQRRSHEHSVRHSLRLYTLGDRSRWGFPAVSIARWSRRRKYRCCIR